MFKVVGGLIGYIAGCLIVVLLAASPVLIWKYDRGEFDQAPWAHLDWRGPVFGHPHIVIGLPLSLAGRVAIALSKADRLEAADAAALARAVVLARAQTQITAQIGARDQVAQARIRTVTQTLIREVPVYVDPKADAACTVPVGFIRLWNSAASGVESVPDSAAGANEAASGVPLDTVGRYAVLDLGAARANAQQLSDLQDWARAQMAAAASAASSPVPR